MTLNPSQEIVTHLGILVRGAHLSRSRFVPVPAEPVRVLAKSAWERGSNGIDWDLSTDSWGSSRAWCPEHWEYLYTSPASELFTDPPQDDNPAGPECFGAFRDQALALHSPLLEAAR